MKKSKIKSISVIKCKDKIPVYDISVPVYENFILSNGCIVHNCKPYLTLKNAIYEERIQLYRTNLLKEELIGLERNNNGKIDHGPSGINSKDTADALCGSIFNASKHAEEFAFEFGEDIQDMIDASKDVSMKAQQKQITLDFEEELKRIQDPLQNKVNNKDDPFLNFGMGKSTPYMNSIFVANGIIV